MSRVVRDQLAAKIKQRLRDHRVVGLIGMRQTGKTSLARHLAKHFGKPVEYFDLERPLDLARLEDPMLALEPLRGLVIIDEIQHKPDLFTVLRVLADRPRTPARFLVLGSASPELLQQSSESLAGRIAYIKVGGFSLEEIGAGKEQKLWLRGGLPLSFLARSNAISLQWREEFITTFLTRDVPSLGISTPPAVLRRFWTMLSHYHGQIWNAAEFARSFGIGQKEVRRYLDQLTGAFAVRQLQPWFENISKRQVKSPKIYLTDCGILHALLGLEHQKDLGSHPKVGASWEGFMLEEIVTRLGARTEECYFWATHSGAELDLLVVRGTKRLGFEFKRSSAPAASRSMHSARETLGLDRIDVIYPGNRIFPMAEGIRALGSACLDDVKPVRR